VLHDSSEIGKDSGRPAFRGVQEKWKQTGDFLQEVHDQHEDEFLIVSLCPDHFLMDAFQEFLGISADLAFRAV